MANLYPSILKLFLSLLLLLLSFTYVFPQSGKVFRDINNNGIAEASDFGVKGIIVTSFKSDNTILGSALTDENGLYALSPVAGIAEPVRVEFSIPDSLKAFFPGAFSSGVGRNGTSVQFVVGPDTDINYAINFPGDFCEATPPVSVVCFVIGAGTTLGDNLLATVPYDANGKDPNQVGHPSAPGTLVGSIWGTAFQRETGWLYSSSFMRRHTAFGPNGTGVIYVTTSPKDPVNSRAFEFINLNGMTVPLVTGGTVTINTGADPHQKSDYYLDLINENGNPTDAVGKISFGDMDMSSDGQYLFVVSLNEHRLYRIAIDSDKNPSTLPTAADVLAYNLPAPTCNGGVLRPYGLGVRGDDLFIGMVCDGSISKQQQDLRAYIYKMNTLTNIFSPVIDFSLDYMRGNISGGEFIREHGKWQPWTDDADWSNYNETVGEVFSLGTRWELVCPQAVLSDIVFDDDGSLVLGFMDRFGHQGIFDGPDPRGTKREDDNTQYRRFNLRAGGDVLRVCNIGTLVRPIYDLEQLGKCGGKGGGQFLEATYEPKEYEYYVGDNFNKDSHTETADGGLGIIPGTNELIMSAFDPINEANGGDIYSNGYRVLNNTTGQEIRGFQLLTEIPPNNGNNLFGKASGVGGIEVLCTAKYLEIGNRVWIDTNKDGIQGPDELPISNVILEIYNDEGALVGTQVTDEKGAYYFNQLNVIDTVGIFRPNRPGLQVDRSYTIRIPASQYNGRGFGPLYGLSVTPSLSTRKAFADGPLPASNIEVRDNNAVVTSGLVSATVHTGYSGENDHNIDLGFAPLPPCSLSLLLTTSQCNSATNQYTLFGTVLTTDLPADGTLIVTNGIASQTITALASSTAIAFSFSALASGTGTQTISVTFSDAWCGPISDTYTAPISCSVPASVSVGNTTVCAGATASLTATGCLGQLSWSGNGLSGTGSVLTIVTSPTITVGTSLSYTATCVLLSSTAVSVGVVEVVPIPVVTLSASPGTTVVQGSSVSLTVSGCQSGLLVWSMGSGFTGLSTVTVNPQASTTYSVSCVNGPGCTGSASLLVETYPPASVSVGNTTVCAGATASLTATGCLGQLSWSGNGLSGTGSVLTIATSPTITVGTSLSYTATCVLLSSTAVSVGVVEVVPIPVVTLSASPSTTVVQGSSVSLSVSGCQSGLLVWSMGSGFTGLSTVTVNPQASTTYSVSCVNGPGCTGSASLLVETYPPASVSVGNTTVCAGATASLTATGCLGQLSWSGNGLSGTGSVLTIATSPTIATNQIESYTVICQTTFSSASAVGSVTINPLPVFNGLSTTCAGDGLSYSVMGSVSPLSATVTTSVGTLTQSGNSFTVSSINTGVTVTLGIISEAGCTAIQLINSPVCQTFCPAIALTVQASSQTLTSGETVDLQASVSPAGSYTYVWAGPNLIGFSPANSASVTTSALPEGVHSFTVTVFTQPGCFTTATVSVTVLTPLASELRLRKLIDKTNAQLGEVLSYTLILENIGNGDAQNVLVRDSLSASAVVIPGSITASIGVFSGSADVYSWSLTSLPANTTATVVYSASVVGEGIIHNTATLLNDTVQVCLSIPFKVCKGSGYAIVVRGPAGYSNYKFYRGNELVYDGILNSYTATAAGEYRAVVDDQTGVCPGLSCCPVIIEEDSIPAFSVIAVPPTCAGTIAQPNGKLQLTGLGGQNALFSYRYSVGNTFNDATASSAAPIPANGILVDGLNTSQTYTIRVYNKLGCYQDVPVVLMVNCDCPTPDCVPVNVRRIK